MVTKGWLSVSMGVILLSASMVNILVSRSMNSLRSAFSASMSLPSRSDVMFTCKHKKCQHARPSEYFVTFTLMTLSLLVQGSPKCLRAAEKSLLS